MTWPEVARRTGSGDSLLGPVGSTEQHGPHLPVTTDTDIAEAVAEGAAGRDAHLVVAAALAYGSSGEHQGFAGTLSIGQDATELVLVELGRSATADFAQVILVSTHGGNSTPVARAVSRLRSEGRSVAAWAPAWGGDLHAGAHAATERPSERSRDTARATGVELPPWVETRITWAKSAVAERPSSTRTSSVASCPMERVPAKPWCSPLDP